MLSELYINNLAVIKSATIQFTDNLNIFTGETGAGKSILINGINAVLGQRTSKEIVRNGCDKSVIVALFTNITKETKDKLSLYGFDFENDELSVTREIFCDGGSVARINSRPATVSVLKDIGQTLINIHGQHDNQILLIPENHLSILDNYAELNNDLEEYRQLFKNLQETARQIKKLVSDETQREYRSQVLRELISEIDALDINDNEDVELENQYKLMDNSALISACVNNTLQYLSGNGESDGAVELCNNAYNELSLKNDLSDSISKLSERLKNTSIELDDIMSEINHFKGEIDFDQNKFDYISQRRDALNSLKKKYGPLLSDVLKRYNDAKSELDSLDNNDTIIENLNTEKHLLLEKVTKKAKELSDLREKAVKKLVQNVESQLKFLDMPNVKLEVLHTKGKLTVTGMDNIEFLISANIGEPPKPIAKIASGGELSRIMLALKCVLADKDNIPTLIFDEIDTGVSGRAAQKIGIKLEEISKIRQVLCVTHLAQIAVMADNHLCIEKKVVDNSTQTNVKSLSFEERKYEIARIMGGENITDLLLENAEELILSAKNK